MHHLSVIPAKAGIQPFFLTFHLDTVFQRYHGRCPSPDPRAPISARSEVAQGPVTKVAHSMTVTLSRILHRINFFPR